VYDLRTGLDWRLLTQWLLWTLWIPVGTAFLLDRWLDTSPYLLLLRRVLWQLDRVIEWVAPPDENKSKNGCVGGSDDLPDTDKTTL
jgi:hypothetical protein